MGLVENSTPVVSPEFAIALGMYEASALRRTGYVGAADTSGHAVRATTYAPQGADAQRSLKSSSASDSSARTGARKVRVTYLNAAFVLKTEDVTLNGTSAVNTVATDIAYLESLEVIESGTQGGNNVGTISIYTQTNGGGSAWGSIAADEGRTFWAHHYVPAGKTCYLLSLYGGCHLAASRLTMARSGDPSGATQPQRDVAGAHLAVAGGSVDHPFRVPIPVTGPDFVWCVIRANTTVSNNAGFATFEFVEL